MAFDNQNPADLAALNTELTTDPASMGYNLNGSASKLVKQLNDPGLNVGGDVIARPFDPAALMEALDPTDFEAQQTVTGADTYSHMLLEMGAYSSIEPYKAKFRSMFAANSGTVQALDAQTVPISRADALFGVGSNISENDIALALSV